MSFSLKKKSILLILIILIVSFLEILSISTVIPVLTALTNPEFLLEIKTINFIYNFLNIPSINALTKILVILFCISILVACAARFFLTWFQAYLTMKIVNQLGVKTFKNILYQPYQVQINNKTNEIITGLTTKIGTGIGGSIGAVLNLISALFISISVVCILFLINPYITLFSILIFGFLYTITANFYKKVLQSDSKKINKSASEIIKVIQEGLFGIREVILNNTFKVFLKIFNNKDIVLRRSQANVQVISLTPRYFFEAFGILIIVIFSYFYSVKNGDLISLIPILGAFALGAQRLLPVFHQLYSNWVLIMGNTNLLKDAIKTLNIKRNKLKLSDKEIIFEKQIILKDISFRYDRKSNNVLNKTNVTIKKGEKIGIIGKTGSGKSTLVDILMGLLRPNKGQLIVDKKIITNLNSSSWHNKISHVPQNIFLLNATIFENIAFGIPYNEIDKEKVFKISKMANISKFIENKPFKYNTIVGERGIKLSGGQVQRIAIARALYKNAELIIFDEATSSLDEVTEKEVLKSIYDLDKKITIIMISHKKSSLKNCDKIFRLENNKVDIINIKSKKRKR